VLGIILIPHHSCTSSLQQFLEPQPASSLEMARGLSNPCFSNDDDHFISLMRMFDENKEHYVDDYRISFPKWIEKYCDYSHIKHTQAGIHQNQHLASGISCNYMSIGEPLPAPPGLERA
jgi:hypothetical protein